MPLLRCLPLEMHSSWRMKFLYLPTVCRSELVADLGFVTVLIFVVTAAEEDAAVEVLAVGDAFELEDEVLVLADGLQIGTGCGSGLRNRSDIRCHGSGRRCRC